MKAIICETESFQKYRVWALVTREIAWNVLTSKRVARRKEFLDENSPPYVKFEVRWVICGFQQMYGVDYEKTFAPAAKFFTVHLMLALVACKSLELHHINVRTDFWNGDLNRIFTCNNPKDLFIKDNRIMFASVRKSYMDSNKLLTNGFRESMCFCANSFTFKLRSLSAPLRKTKLNRCHEALFLCRWLTDCQLFHGLCR